MAKLGDFVTARLVNGEDGVCCQGVYAADYPDGTVRVEGESGEDYHCDPGHMTTVPPCNLWGDTAIFAATRRKQLRPFEEER